MSTSCAICMELLKSELVVLPCGHVYHHLCIQTWSAQRPSCPMCKKEYDSSRDVRSLDFNPMVRVQQLMRRLEQEEKVRQIEENSKIAASSAASATAAAASSSTSENIVTAASSSSTSVAPSTFSLLSSHPLLFRLRLTELNDSIVLAQERRDALRPRLERLMNQSLDQDTRLNDLTRRVEQGKTESDGMRATYQSSRDLMAARQSKLLAFQRARGLLMKHRVAWQTLSDAAQREVAHLTEAKAHALKVATNWWIQHESIDAEAEEESGSYAIGEPAEETDLSLRRLASCSHEAITAFTTQLLHLDSTASASDILSPALMTSLKSDTNHRATQSHLNHLYSTFLGHRNNSLDLIRSKIQSSQKAELDRLEAEVKIIQHQAKQQKDVHAKDLKLVETLDLQIAAKKIERQNPRRTGRDISATSAAASSSSIPTSSQPAASSSSSKPQLPHPPQRKRKHSSSSSLPPQTVSQITAAMRAVTAAEVAKSSAASSGNMPIYASFSSASSTARIKPGVSTHPAARYRERRITNNDADTDDNIPPASQPHAILPTHRMLSTKERQQQEVANDKEMEEIMKDLRDDWTHV